MERSTITLMIASALILFSSQALALDGYQHRKGLFGGLGFGGAHIKSDADAAKGHIGYNFRARIGGGVNERLTLEAELGINTSTYTQSGAEVEDTTRTIGLGANFFLGKEFYLRAVGGIAEAHSKVSSSSNKETGLFAAGGAGFEFFANSDLAIGVGVDFQHQIYDESSVNALSFGVTANWY